MDRVYKSGAVGAAPAAADNASGPYPAAGNAQLGVAATKPGPYWYHMITEEIYQVILAAGLVPDKAVLTQLRDSIATVANAGRAGSVFLHGSTTPPTGAVKANGATLTRASFVALFGAIGTQHNKTFTGSLATDNLTCTAHGFATGNEVDVASWDGGALPAPLLANTTYWARSVDANTISLHPTLVDANNNTNKINLTTDGSGKLTIAPRLSFMVPEIRGEFLRGWDDGRSIDTGRVAGSAQAQAIQAHTHSLTHNNQPSYAGGGVNAESINAGGSNTGSTGGTETRPRNVALLACIWYQ